MNPRAEQHPLGFFLPGNARILMLGSFPPDKKRWSMDFYYPNFQNDMWRIMGMVFFQERDYFILPGKKAFDEHKIKNFCQAAGIAFGDTATEIIRLKANASDKFLEVVSPWTPETVLSQIPCCEAIAVTGQKAMDTLLQTLPAGEPRVGACTDFSYMGRPLKLYRMPSSSRAYPLPVKDKADVYRRMFADLGMVDD